MKITRSVEIKPQSATCSLAFVIYVAEKYVQQFWLKNFSAIMFFVCGIRPAKHFIAFSGTRAFAKGAMSTLNIKVFSNTFNLAKKFFVNKILKNCLISKYKYLSII